MRDSFEGLQRDTLQNKAAFAGGILFRRRFSSSKERRRPASEVSRPPRVFTANNVRCRGSNAHPLTIPILGRGLGFAGRRNMVRPHFVSTCDLGALANGPNWSQLGARNRSSSAKRLNVSLTFGDHSKAERARTPRHGLNIEVPIATIAPSVPEPRTCSRDPGVRAVNCAIPALTQRPKCRCIVFTKWQRCRGYVAP